MSTEFRRVSVIPGAFDGLKVMVRFYAGKRCLLCEREVPNGRNIVDMALGTKRKLVCGTCKSDKHVEGSAGIYFYTDPDLIKMLCQDKPYETLFEDEYGKLYTGQQMLDTIGACPVKHDISGGNYG